MKKVMVLVGTRKGLWILTSDARRRKWTQSEPALFGQIAWHAVLDPRDRRTILVASSTGHLGPTVFRSTDFGKTWKEAAKPPAFTPAVGDSVKHVFWLSPGHASEPGVWYAGTGPHGLFRTSDGGATWEGLAGYNENPQRKTWRGIPEQQPPDFPSSHSINVDPRDPKHLYVGFSGGGVMETLDGGASWKPLNKGVESPYAKDPEVDLSGYDPHCVRIHPRNPDRIWMQSHFGIYRLDRPSDTWVRVGKNMPKATGDIGFPIVLDPENPDRAWVVPMDGTEVWPRTSVGGKPAVFVTKNGGASWQKQAKGFPPARAWWTVKRQAFGADGLRPLGLYFGTMNGQVWASRTEGGRWETIADHLPAVISVEAATC
jgi:photosystem II stability/assembly factor-like uncharacterized protein